MRHVAMSQRTMIAIAIACSIFCAILFFIIGYFGRNCSVPEQKKCNLEDLVKEADPRVQSFFGQNIEAGLIRNHLQKLTEKPHVAGRNEDPALTYLLQEWQKLAAQKIEGLSLFNKTYDVLLSEPRENLLTKFSVLLANGSLDFISQTEEKILSRADNVTGIPRPILAYAPEGTVTGELVYANFGSEDDFNELKNRSIDLTGTIALTRYGNVGRGEKAVNAKKFGCVGVIVFSDPDPWAKDQINVYPSGLWLPDTGVQKGSALLTSGDPSTPDYPSISSAFRKNLTLPEDTVDIFPPLPMYPVGYGDAKKLLDLLNGTEAPTSWQGSIANTTYRIGKGMMGQRLLKLEVHQFNAIRKITNSYLMIKGSIEPDRYVIVGNHRDAWGLGSVDPSSGTAVMLEFSRVLVKAIKDLNWRPRRSILLCSWDGEEHGLIGSWEWVEEYLPLLQQATVGYINVDISTRGNFSARPAAVAHLQTFVENAMSNVKDATTFDAISVAANWRNKVAKNNTAPNVMSTPTSGSDYAAFITKAGIPVMDFTFINNPNITTFYPLYHSRYETFEWVDQVLDPGFRSQQSVARMLGEGVRLLADDYLLPYASSTSLLATDITNKVKTLSNVPELQTMASAELKNFQTSVEAFQKSAADFDRHVIDINIKTKPFQMRALNDAAMKVLSCFTTQKGLPFQENIKNLVYASPHYDRVSDVSFPGLSDLIFKYRQVPNTENMNKIRHHLTVLTFHVTLADNILSEWKL